MVDFQNSEIRGTAVQVVTSLSSAVFALHYGDDMFIFLSCFKVTNMPSYWEILMIHQRVLMFLYNLKYPRLYTIIWCMLSMYIYHHPIRA